MGSFKHKESKHFDHPYLIYKRSGRPSATEMRQMVERASRPFVDAVQRELRRRIQPALMSCEYLFFNHVLTTKDGKVKEHYIDVTLTHDESGRATCGPIAVVSMIQPGVMRWTRDYKNTLIYRDIAENADIFRDLFIEGIRDLFGDCIVVE